MNTRRAQAGLSLIEMMVAMVIGAVLIFGAAQVYVNSKSAYGANESVARLQETARYAMSVIEPDVRMSNYWGLLKGAAVIGGQLPQSAASAAPVAAGAAANVCGRNFATDVSTNLQGDNNAYTISPTRQAGCDTLLDLGTGVAWTTTPVTTADTLTVRRASVFDAAPGPAGTLQVCTSRIAGRLMSDGLASSCPAAVVGQPDALAVAKLENLIVDTYYIDQNSQQQQNLPSLRRKTVTSVGGVTQFRDQEIIAGVEDMQVQFGIDPIGNTGVATRYVNPDGVPAGAQIVAVRIWLLVRAETPENNFLDARIYQYGDRLQATGLTGNLDNAADAGKAYQPSLSADASYATGPARVRRLLISRTIQVRNALGT
ncbi:MAG: PilW family protein [Gammaproteobacteria bacterium]|nr:PilW family protein [Gammaproteobacteria bacterium]